MWSGEGAGVNGKVWMGGCVGRPAWEKSVEWRGCRCEWGGVDGRVCGADLLQRNVGLVERKDPRGLLHVQLRQDLLHRPRLTGWCSGLAGWCSGLAGWCSCRLADLSGCALRGGPGACAVGIRCADTSAGLLPAPLAGSPHPAEVWEGPQRPQRRDRPHRGDVRSPMWVVAYGIKKNIYRGGCSTWRSTACSS